MSSGPLVDKKSIKNSALYQTLVRVADKQAQERVLGLRKPLKRVEIKSQPRRGPGRPRKVIPTLDPHPAAWVGTRQIPDDVQGYGKEISDCKVKIQEDSKKRQYKSWSKEKISHVLMKYDEFLRLHESKKNGRALAMRRTLKHFGHKFGYKGLCRQHIQYWKKSESNNNEGDKRGRKCILSDGTMQAIHVGIMDMVKAKVHKVTSNSLYPLISIIIEERGEQHKIGDEPGKLKLTKWWINRECRRLGLAMRCTTSAT